VRIALAALAMLAPAGCGGGSSNGYAEKPPNEVVRAAERAALDAESVHIGGEVIDNGARTAINLTLAAGKGGKGKLSERGVAFEIIRVGDTVYLRGSDAFWRQFAGEKSVDLLHGRWLTAPADNEQFSEIAKLLDPAEVFHAALRDHGKLANWGATDYDGRHAVEIEDTTKGGSLYVAADGEPYPLAIVGEDSDDVISFDDWNADVELTAPKSAIDIATLIDR
jgi:hypothetical protein